tara:strand:- start:7 stop:1035 length:1029 start_codon:yes stop_codon:yes gene_type:complete
MSKHIGTTGDSKIDKQLVELADSIQGVDNAELLAEMLTTAVRISKGKVRTHDFQMLNRATKELESTCEMFAPYTDKLKVAIYGSARTAKEDPAYIQTAEFAKRMTDEGYMTITGGGPGIMEAGNAGAGIPNSFGLGITLPFEQTHTQLAGDPKFFECNYFFTRKVTLIRETHASVACPGGFGTMDEIFEALTLIQTGKCRLHPVVLLDKPGGTYWSNWNKFVTDGITANGNIDVQDFNLFKITDCIDTAVKEITDFYSNFHSYRYVKDKLVIRTQRKLDTAMMKRLNDEFAEIVESGTIKQYKAFAEESNRPDLDDKNRIVFNFNKKDFGILRQLINTINTV